jgi:hypothetical protein
MAIDPRLYTKYSGRTGDPRDRLGAALVQADNQRAKNRERKEVIRMGLRPRIRAWGFLRLFRFFG